MRITAVAAALAAAVVVAPAAAAVGNPDVAALQVGLQHEGLYRGTVDGLPGPATAAAVRALQRRAGLSVDGVAGPRTRRALGRLGRPPLGSRPLVAPAVGRDVAALQFLLAWRGFPSGPFDGVLGARTDAALRRFQRWAGLGADGVAGPATLRALRRPPARLPLRLAWPLAAPVGSLFGPRGARFHPGIDLPAARGTPVRAARGGRVAFAGWSDGYGRLVVLTHGSGVTTQYAHLARIDVRPGARVRLGARIGRVGSSGESTGPHLHFEARLRGAAVDPLPALP